MNAPEIERHIAELEKQDRAGWWWELIRVLWEIALQLAKSDMPVEPRGRRMDSNC
jgi:hypothetical protein